MPAPSSLFFLAMLRAGQQAPGFRGFRRGLGLACGLIAAGTAQAAEPAVAAPADAGQGYACLLYTS